MSILKKIFGICETGKPDNANAWKVQGGKVTVDLSILPELNTAGNAVRLEGNGLDRRILVVHGEDGVFHAFENRCTHMGRRLDPGRRPDTVKCCSVSGSVFDLSGKPVAGAARRPVKTFDVRKEGDILEVNLQ